MATKIKDRATAELAARNLQTGIEPPAGSEPNAPVEKTTSQKLFPDFTTDDGGIINRPVRDMSAPATPTPEIQSQTPPTQPPTVAPITYLKPEDLTGKTAKLKVDGVEIDVPAESLFKTNQLERHLNARIQKLAEEQAKFEMERANLLRQPPAPLSMPETPKSGKTPDAPTKKLAEVEALEAQLAQMRANFDGLQTMMLPQIQEAGIKRVANMVKEEFGADDFRSYFDQIKATAMSEVSKPENAGNPQAVKWFDSDQYYFQQYQRMKLKGIGATPPTPAVPSTAPAAPALMTQGGSPVVMNSQGQPRSIPTIEGSGGVPSRTPNGDWAVRAQSALDTARQTGRTEDWAAYLRLKTEG